MRRRARKSVRRGHAPLRMTSMMDILTVLLLFLLKSFVVDAELVTPASGLTLPESMSEESPRESVVIAVVGDVISLGDQVITRVEEHDGELLIAELADALDDAREAQETLARRKGAELDEAARVTIQGDREMPFVLLQKVMYTCNQSGFDDISLAVLRSS